MLIPILLACNLLTFALHGIDKWKACHDRWRIPEATLLLAAACGGSLGALSGMYLFHHKTRKPRFRYGVPAMLALQLGVYLLFRFHVISL